LYSKALNLSEMTEADAYGGNLKPCKMLLESVNGN